MQQEGSPSSLSTLELSPPSSTAGASARDSIISPRRSDCSDTRSCTPPPPCIPSLAKATARHASRQYSPGRCSGRSWSSERRSRSSRSSNPQHKRRRSRSRSSGRERRPSRSWGTGRHASWSWRPGHPPRSTSSNTDGDRRTIPARPSSHTARLDPQIAASTTTAVPVEVRAAHTRHTVMHAAGHAFMCYNQSDVRTSYRCSAYRNTKCKAKLHFIHKNNEYEFLGEHSCKRGRRAALPPGLDVTEDMKEATDTTALTRMDLTAERIWKKLRDDFYPESLSLVQYGLTREQVIQRVHRTRRSHFGADLHGVVEVPPLSLVPGSWQPFFQFYRSYMNGSTLERLVGWAHPALIKLLKYKRTTLFLDGTFRCVPRPFYQCVVMMVFDNAIDLFVPVFYTLCTAKTQESHWHLMEAVNVVADDKIEPSVVVCDFEEGLQAAAQVQFPDADIVGCYFHFKQACRRKMKALGIPEAETTIAMSKDCLDMLTVIPHEKIDGPGISYVQAKIRSMCTDQNVAYTELLWEMFWSYFRKTWLKIYKPSVWNVYNVRTDPVSRTNNPLERFNRKINAALTSPHPALPAFVAILQVLSQRYVDRIDDMTKCRAKKRQQRNISPVNIPVPVDFGGTVAEATTDK